MANTDVIIVAAGSSERFGGGEPKQFVLLAGKAVLLWSVERFASCAEIHSIIIVAAPNMVDRVRSLTDGVAKVTQVVAGGATRQESVELGVRALTDDSHNVLVHDAARPCLSSSLLTSILDALGEHEAVVPALPVADTLVHAPRDEVDAIVDRVNVHAVQTPQAFRTELLRRAHRRAEARNFTSSDDGSVVFALGERGHLIPGESTNIKITMESDLRIAEVILAQESTQR
jgi:2-C-methyl-D-erythritol 4-phosphate cytidylyltransferase